MSDAPSAALPVDVPVDVPDRLAANAAAAAADATATAALPAGSAQAPAPHDLQQALQERVRTAAAARTPLCIRGSGSKDFYGRVPHGTVLDVSGHRGIVAYEPTELVLTARCGTPLAEIEAVLAERQQMLAFEPPHFGPGATLGGCLAAGLAGPRRQAAGGVRDFVLGARLLDGKGQVLDFGGRVMKNVAGYDVARALAGSLGQLGVILEASIKVLPVPAATHTLRFAMDQTRALSTLNQWAGTPLPISASAWHDGELTVRLGGAAAAVRAAVTTFTQAGGASLEADVAAAFWIAVREQTHAFFAGAAPLWRFAVPSTVPALACDGAQFIEWGGGQRWLKPDSTSDVAALRSAAAAAGGHLTLFRGSDAERCSSAVFQPLPAPLARIQRALKAGFDPAGILNPGRLYADL